MAIAIDTGIAKATNNEVSIFKPSIQITTTTAIAIKVSSVKAWKIRSVSSFCANNEVTFTLAGNVF